MMEKRPLRWYASLLGGEQEGNPLIAQLVVDSRQVAPGALFFALPGAREDGHTFLKEVALRGGVAAVVAESYRGETHGLALIRVPDVKHALQEGAKQRRRQLSGRVIGITGSVGKTTIKEFTLQLLRHAGLCVDGTEKSENSQLTLPLTLLRVDSAASWIVLEMAMTEPGQIERLTEIAAPTLALLASVEYQHVAHFSSLEEIAFAKAEIFLSPLLEEAICVEPVAGVEGVQRRSLLPLKRFSLVNREAHWFAERREQKFTIWEGGKEACTLPWTFSAPHHLHNFLAAAALARSAGLYWDEIASGAASLLLPPSRFTQVEKKGILLIDDSYNSSPAGMEAALLALASQKITGRRFALLTGMPLGQWGEQLHSHLGKVAATSVDQLFCFGVESEPMLRAFLAHAQEGQSASSYPDREALVQELRRVLRPGDLLLIKGINQYRLWELIQEL